MAGGVSYAERVSAPRPALFSATLSPPRARLVAARRGNPADFTQFGPFHLVDEPYLRMGVGAMIA